MPRPWVLKKVREVALSLSCRICPSLWRRGISPPSQMSRLLVMSMEPCAAWRLRRFEKKLLRKILSMSCVNAACSSIMIQKTKRIKIKVQERTGLFFSHKAYTSKPKSYRVQQQVASNVSESLRVCRVPTATASRCSSAHCSTLDSFWRQ